MWNQWKLSEKMTKDWNFYLFWAPNGPKIGPLRPIFHTFLTVHAMNMWSNTDVKPVKTFLRKWPKTGIFTCFGAQNGLEIGPQIVHIFDSFEGPKNLASVSYLLHTYKSISKELINQVSSESSGNFAGKLAKTYILTYFGSIWGQKRPENLAQRDHFHRHLKVPTMCP